MNKHGFIYILTNKNNSTFYVGVTSDLIKRIYEHKQERIDGFTKRYHLTKVVYYEFFEIIELAIKREKQIKNWHRDWKINLIKKSNSVFKDLYKYIVDAETSSA